MVLTPALRGLFGLDWDALNRTLRIAPHLPAGWDSARLVNVPLGDSRLEIEYRREGARLIVSARQAKPEVICLVPQQDAARDQPCQTAAAAVHQLVLDLPPVEIGIPHKLPLAGSETRQLKVAGERYSANQAEFVFEARGGTTAELPLRINRTGVRVSGGEITGGKLRVHFPDGAGYQRSTITFSW
jgi:hypothetical protein